MRLFKFVLSFSFSCIFFQSAFAQAELPNTPKSTATSEQQETYIVTLTAPPLVSYKGGIKGIPATHQQQIKTTSKNKLQTKRKLDTRAAAAIAYTDYLGSQHKASLERIASSLKRQVKPIHQYVNIVNGFAVRLTTDEAKRVKQLDGVNSVIKDFKLYKHTDQGPQMIRADDIWTGGFNSTEARGEGVVVGILDTGIIHAHPSFAATSSDGYTHVNPLGPNVYLGLCVETPSLCNSKLIGSYNFVEGSFENEDEDGHGTHVAGTAAGNRLEFDIGNNNAYVISGVAPRANVISYKIAGQNGVAANSAILAAIEQAVTDQVDVMNLSFGGEAGGTPWQYQDLLAFLNAREAGIVAVVSAGNDGPDPARISYPGMAPWVTSVAATTHERGAYPSKRLTAMSGGDLTPPAEITGRSLSGSITGSIVYAGNFVNGDSNPEQCLNPFPANTFTSDQIVLCDRGEIARVEKAQNVAAGGAGGFILGNVDGGADNLADDFYVVPGIHIAATDANAVRTWLASGNGHTGTITGTDGVPATDPNAGDIVAIFSSRGPSNNLDDFLTPSVGAPGVNILAASLPPVDYAYLNGTSMASPHVAGAAALLVQLHPDWSPSAIQSALATTGETGLITHTGDPANPFDIGGGRVDTLNAVNASLVFEETPANFRAADPSLGGSPRDMNLPSATDMTCRGSCSWTRTVTATTANTWNASPVTDVAGSITVSPASFTLAEGETQQVTISATTSGNVSNNDWLFGAVQFAPTQGANVPIRVPVSARAIHSSLTGTYRGASLTSDGSLTIDDITGLTVAEPVATGYLVQATELDLTISNDTDSSEAWFDDVNAGTNIRLVDVPAGAKAMMVYILGTEPAADLDLYIGIDLNENGTPEEFEIVEVSQNRGSAIESIELIDPTPGSYWVLVHNNEDAATATYEFDLNIGVVPATASSNLSFDLPASIDGETPFSLTINWENLNPINTRWYGVFEIGTADDPDYSGKALLRLQRGSTPDPEVQPPTGGGGGGGGGSLGIASLLALLLSVAAGQRTFSRRARRHQK